MLYSPHSFRVTTITDLLEQNVPREDMQHLAGHSERCATDWQTKFIMGVFFGTE
jgi:hypothetical protein